MGGGDARATVSPTCLKARIVALPAGSGRETSFSVVCQTAPASKCWRAGESPSVIVIFTLARGIKTMRLWCNTTEHSLTV